MSAEDNKAIFLRLLEELEKGNLDVIEEVFAPNVAFYSPDNASWDWPRGVEGARKLLMKRAAAVPDLQTTVDDIFAVEDKVVVRWTFRGTHKGEPKLEFLPLGKFTSVALSIYRFANGKIEEDWTLDAVWPTGQPWT